MKAVACKDKMPKAALSFDDPGRPVDVTTLGMFIIGREASRC